MKAVPDMMRGEGVYLYDRTGKHSDSSCRVGAPLKHFDLSVSLPRHARRPLLGIELLRETACGRATRVCVLRAMIV